MCVYRLPLYTSSQLTDLIIGYQKLMPLNINGQLLISLELNRKLSTELALHLMEDAVVSPGEVTLFNHPDSSTTLHISGGKLKY